MFGSKYGASKLVESRGGLGGMNAAMLPNINPSTAMKGTPGGVLA
jgi:hypothetical protein